MSCSIYSGIIGGVTGFVTWAALLEGPKMGGVIFRRDSNNNTVFTPNNVVEYLKAPFKYEYFWRDDFFQHNWIVMCGTGALMGCLASLVPT